MMIVDDITPIRNITKDVLESETTLLPSRANYINGVGLGGNFPGEAGQFVGPNSIDEAVIIYYLRDRVVTGDVKLEIYDNSGALLKTIPGTKRKGINRVTWDMRLKPPKVAKGVTPGQSGFSGPQVKEGTYTVKLVVNGKSYTSTLELTHDPNSPYSADEISMRDETVQKLFKMNEDLAYVVHNMNKVRDESNKYIESSKLSESNGKALVNKLEELRKTIEATKEVAGITGEERTREFLDRLYGSVTFGGGRPTDSQLDRIQGLQNEIQKGQQAADEIYRTLLTKVNAELQTNGEKKIEILSRDAFDNLDNSGNKDKKEIPFIDND